MECGLAVKGKEFVVDSGTWINLGHIMQSGRSRTECLVYSFVSDIPSNQERWKVDELCQGLKRGGDEEESLLNGHRVP